jgi:hypothetical protein
VILFRDATNPTVPVHPRQVHPLRQARYEAATEVLVSQLQVQRVQAERLVPQIRKLFDILARKFWSDRHNSYLYPNQLDVRVIVPALT